jgi:hypothetical protein
MAKETSTPTTEHVPQPNTRRKSIEKSLRTFPLTEVDGAIAIYDKTIRMNTELVKTKLSSGVGMPCVVHHDLSFLMLIARLHARNEYLNGSHHPIRYTLMNQAGTRLDDRVAFLTDLQ